jgi:integrase/recombinase XerD
VQADLSQAALSLTGRRSSPLPQGIGRADATALLASCDRRTGIGRRDYALLIVLLRLGLRRTPATEVPPANVFAVSYRRPTPYLWSPADIGRLLAAARALRPPLRAATFEALFGLLAVTGMRVGEAVALERADVDLNTGVITIRAQIAKLERTRPIPLHPTTTDPLRRYAAERERLCPRPRSTAFFLSRTGTALDRSSIAKTLRQITTALGLRSQTVRPRAQDLRHSFAVRTLIDWQRSGQIAPRIATLSTYLGHVSPAET